MQVFVANFNNNPIRYIKLPDNGLLINTKDYCLIAGITERPSGHVLAQPCLDIVSAINFSGSADFAIWLNETFVGYNIETLVHPTCNDEWNFA
jgi:hypothetical protein